MRRSSWSWVTALAALSGAAWLPFAGRTLSPDEGGLLILADQWSAGSSLYGDYFVDRPPLLVAIFALADALGGSAWVVRGLGILAVVATVLLAGLVGQLAANAPLLPAATAAALVCTPLFGSTVVNGELLGLPFLVGGSAAVLAAAREEDWLRWGLLAGALGACGALVKQSLLDVFVLAAVLLVLRRRPRALLAVATGAAVTVVVAVALAASRGTDPGDLWQGVVVFRQDAGAVITQSATSATMRRLGVLALAVLGTGLPLLLLALARRLRASVDLRRPALAVLAWELLVVLAGGSYWLHYLMGLVPGLVLLTAAGLQHSPRPDRLVRASYAVLAASTVIGLLWVLAQPIHREEEPAIAWLEGHAQPGDTAIVAFGAANILRETGLRSPYPDLWSLPVRVHDPELTALCALLTAPSRPTWLVVAGRSLATWGVDASAADRVLHEHYAEVTAAGGWTIWSERR